MTLEGLRGRVLEMAYLWRYAIVTPGADVDAAEQALVAAVDALDEEQAAVADAEPERAARREQPRHYASVRCTVYDCRIPAHYVGGRLP